MAMRIVTYAERPDLLDAREWNEAWPPYNLHGDVVSRYWARLFEAFPDYQFFLCAEDEKTPLAKGHCAPCAWDGTALGLPEGIDDAIYQAFELHDTGEPTDAVTALAIEVPPENQGRGLSAVMVRGMAEVVARQGCQDLIAPVRPSWKERYPLVPIERYAHWRRGDDLPFDPWIRVHHRLGGEIMRPTAQSLRITGTVAEWEEWTEMPFPESGTYVFPHGLAPLEIDRDRDLGSYWEPNVWMHHWVPVDS